MTPVWWMLAASVSSGLALSLAAPTRLYPEVLFGMLGPLTGAVGSWMATSRTVRVAPERTTAVMMVGLAIKMAFFAAYVTLMLRVLGLRPVPFVVSFVSYFVALFVMQALWLRRLFEARARASHA